MAHNVRIDKFQQYAKDGHLLKGKYSYVVSCKQCGRLHKPGETIASAAVAGYVKGQHHAVAKARHVTAHPHDTRYKNVPTKKRVQNKMVKLRG